VLDALPFRDAVWLFCPAFVLHVIEEWPRFTRWAQTHASEQFTRRQYNTIHIAGIAASLVTVTVVWFFPNRFVVFLFFTFAFAPSAFFNTLFHAGASVLTKTYCPGIITAIAIHLPLFFIVAQRACTEGLLTSGALVVSLSMAGAFHTWEVGHNVFKAW